MSSQDKKRGSRSQTPKNSKKYRTADLTTRRLALSAMLAALALIFSYVEALIPIPVPVPGIKLGIANLVIVMAIYKLGFRYAFVINCVRIVIAGLLFSGVFLCRRYLKHFDHVLTLSNEMVQYGGSQYGRRCGP